MKHNADNLTTELAQTEQGQRIVVEPEYVGYLRSHNYQIKSLDELHTVESESKDGGGYVVVKITTYEHPKGHEELDLVADEMQLNVCSCWAYRKDSNDVAEEGMQPGGSCKHTKSCFRTEKAENDPLQDTITGP